MKITLSPVSIVVPVLAAIFSASGSNVATAQKQFPPIVIGVGPDAAFTSFVVGVKEGIFKKHGISASIQLFPAGPATLEAVLAGNADVGSSSQFTFTAMLAKGGKFKIISQIYTTGELQCAVAKEGIAKPADLLGRTVATQLGGMGQYHADRYIERFGLDASKITFKNIAYGQIVPAFAAGDMDAFFAFEPHCTRAVDTVKGSHILNRSGQDDVVLARAYVVVNEKIYSNQAFGVALVRALVEAGDWTKQNSDKAAADISAEFNIPPADAKRFIEYIDFNQVKFDKPARDELERALAYYVKLKSLPKVPDISPYVTTEFVDAAK